MKAVIVAALGLWLLGGCAVAPSSSAPSPAPSVSVASVSATASTTTQTTTSTPTPTASVKSDAPAGQFELPLVGATGFASLATTAKPDGDLVGAELKPGDPFTIVAVRGANWLVKTPIGGGLIASNRAMVNLPDLVPSIVYRDTNGEASVFRSSRIALPDVTGVRLYESKADNPRLGASEHYMPVRYAVALRLQDAQRRALAHGQTLIIIETFRPWDVQRKVGDTLVALAAANPTVKTGLTRGGRDVLSFIARQLSNHQLGVAIDLTLGTVTATERRQGDAYSFDRTTASELTMPSPIHELSEDAAVTDWTSPKAANAKQLRAYCEAAGLSPIASEWWHFEDRAERDVARSLGVDGRFRLTLPAP